MKFGMQFFPDMTPDRKPAQQYYDESLRLVELCDSCGFSHVRTVEHYFHRWGGYTPSPIVFLSAASQRTRKARMVTGALIPSFNHPLKMAAEIAMLDGISGGRLDVGFARAFLPQEFAHFEVDIDESVPRFEEGMMQVALLLENETVTSRGRFHSFENVTSWPRPTQKPRPPFFVAVVGTPASFERAGRMGHHIMAIPGVGSDPMEMMGSYREAYRSAGHPGAPQVMMAVYMYCRDNRDDALRIAEHGIEGHFASIVDAMEGYRHGTASDSYRGYDVLRRRIAEQTLESQIKSSAAFVGTPDDIVEQLHELDRAVGGCDHASMQVNFHDLSYEEAAISVRLFGEKVAPAFALTSG